jgi:MoxR-like ATPase
LTFYKKFGNIKIQTERINRVKKIENMSEIIAKVEKSKTRFKAVDADGNLVDGISASMRRKAFDNDKALQRVIGKTGRPFWRLVNIEEFASVDTKSAPTTERDEANMEIVEVPEKHDEIVDFIKNSYSIKPRKLFMSETKWKYLVRSAVRGKNVMMTGSSGCGKTLASKTLAEVLDRPFFYFNLGATQDPRSALIGNTHFKKDTGTVFAESSFIKAIRTPNSIILLDELSRAHPDAWNILMTPLDPLQRYVRLDESEDSEVVPVAKNVTFVATANVGNEYTATRVMDRALLDRFVTVEMDELDYEEEVSLLKMLYPDADINMLGVISTITTKTREVVRHIDAKLTDSLSTRSAVEMAGLAYDGFTLVEIAEAAIYPYFSPDGGADSERTFMKQTVQKFVHDETTPEDLISLKTDENQDDAVIKTPY